MPILREDKDLREALKAAATVCVVGISPDPYKPSYFVSDVLQTLHSKESSLAPVIESHHTVALTADGGCRKLGRWRHP